MYIPVAPNLWPATNGEAFFVAMEDVTVNGETQKIPVMHKS